MSGSLYDYKAPDYKRLTQAELVELWRQHRNDTVGVMAADEVMFRLATARKAQ